MTSQIEPHPHAMSATYASARASRVDAGAKPFDRRRPLDVSSRARRRPASRGVVVRAAKKLDKDGFFNWLSREIEITFNPRTPGAKIAGRCPDTQTQPTEVSPDRLSAIGGGDDEEEGMVGTSLAKGDFDLKAFTAELEAAMLAGNDDEAMVEEPMMATKTVVTTEIVEDGSVMMNEDEDDEDDFAYETDGASEGPLSGRELALLCIKKYGKAHDMAIKHVKMGSGMKRWVSLNLYVGHLGQRSYPQTETEYLDQLDVISYLINSWGQADYCRAFFREKPIARRGLPSRPRVDTCVTLQFSRSPTWDDELGDEFFPY